MRTTPEIRGEAPPIAGQICEELICQQYWSRGRLEDPANLIHLKFEGRWFRLYIDWGCLVWQPGASAPESGEAPGLGASYPLFDLAAHFSLKGRRLHSVIAQPLLGGLMLSLLFEGGPRLAFRNLDAITSWFTGR